MARPGAGRSAALILEVSTEQGDIVLDPFCGSGTACVAAEMGGRHWIGIEQDPVAESVLPEGCSTRSTWTGVTLHGETVSWN